MKEESKPEIETESATETVTETAPEPESKPIDPETGEVIDIDLNDPAAEDAAVKIQVKRPSINKISRMRFLYHSSITSGKSLKTFLFFFIFHLRQLFVVIKSGQKCLPGLK